MPRPSLRRATSTPVVRARALSNPYPSPASLSSSLHHTSSSIFSIARSSSSSSSSGTSPMSTSIGSGTASRPPLVSSSSSSSHMQDAEYFSLSDPAEPPSPSAALAAQRRVLADITWWFDNQLGCPIMEDQDPSESSLAPAINDELGLVADSEFTSQSPEMITTEYPPSPASSVTSTESRLSTVLEESNILATLPDFMPMKINRREASFSSISSCSDFEDVVPCPSFV